MTVLFVGTSAADFIGNQTPYTGAAQSRDTNYAAEEIAAACASNFDGGPFETPQLTTSSNVFWVHFRAVFPTDTDSSAADGLFMTVRQSGGTVLGGIDWNNGNMRAQASTFVFGGEFSHTPGTVYTIDLKVDCSAGYSVELYVDGLLVSSATTGTGARVPAYVEFDMNDMLGVGTPNTDAYFSEFFIDDADTTVDCRVNVATANADGNYTEMTGSYIGFQDPYDSNVVVGDTDGQRQSWTPPAYAGNTSGVSVRSVAVTTSAITGSVIDSFTPFLRISGTDYYSSLESPGASVPIVSTKSFATNPATAAAWDIADMATFEIGVRAEVV